MSAPHPPHPELQPERTQGWLSTLGWAAYLACSWTWCIGMFLPVLLVRDYGMWGFVAFAVPNVIGAAAMGWVLRDGAVSKRLAKANLPACLVFSLVTVSFHVYFLVWVIGSLIPSTGPVPRSALAMCAGIVAAVVGLSLLASRERPALVAPLVVWFLSLVAGAFFLVVSRQFGVHGAPTHLGLRPPLRDVAGMVWLAPVCIFGFALCPYLDLTFHLARQRTTPRAGAIAFSLGFGILFLAMILFTLAYAASILSGYAYAVFAIANLAVVMQFTCQSIFTMSLHGSRVLKSGPKSALLGGTGLVVAIAIGFLIALNVLREGQYTNLTHIGMVSITRGEIVYRLFMSFYGLLFPAYVWLCMIPTPDGHSGIEGPRGQRKLIVLAIACTLAAPCYWMGFIERVELWLAPGLGIVLLSRLLVRAPVARPAAA